MNDLDLIRRLARGFIWLGATACGIQLILAIPAVHSWSGFLLTVSDTLGRLSSTVGLGAVILALASIAQSFRQEVENPGPSTELWP